MKIRLRTKGKQISLKKKENKVKKERKEVE